MIVISESLNNGYARLVQESGKTPHSKVVKYDNYNPDIKIADNVVSLLLQ